MEKTLGILKPDAVRRQIIGELFQRIEQSGFRLIQFRKVLLSEASAALFYEVHKDKPFFSDLLMRMSSGPCVPFVLEAENAVCAYRELMGPVKPEEAPKGTLRGDFGLSLSENTVHGSDSLENASKEISFFFSNFDCFF